MSQYYIPHLPRSAELYHNGIKGQKWGVRRFQNLDRTWTEAGKQRYGRGGLSKATETIKSGAKKVGDTVGKVTKKAGNALVKAIKKRHPSLMSDEELIAAKKRMELEKSYREVKDQINSKKFSGKFKAAAGDVIKNGADTLVKNIATNTASEIAARMLESKTERNSRRLMERAELNLVSNTSSIVEDKQKLDKINNKLQDTNDAISETMNYEKLQKLNKKKAKLEKQSKQIARTIKDNESLIEKQKTVLSTGSGIRRTGNSRGGGNNRKNN